MYKTILIPVENRETDQTILQHIRPLARLTHAMLMLVLVADGWAARNYEEL
jgi:nucleotide-binding universal stress UspA family protein